ncbi:MAG: pyridoxal phosphate-dependent aminotransferase [Planctomycetes bacterium]|nr:pyridoxal phosphate-dependent aminotransferase [Planctomycetota bacterium]MBU1519066.1 pyridoxal phosphate-dependent aminotransferase [Planctomycetota bacterium]MBU2596379.1 pyridoxal phosphate-dependent aminotransferase [Planctomycetota bacterium]
MKLSNITSKLIGQAMFELMTKANELERQGKKIIHLEIGDPNFDPPKEAVLAANEALNKGLSHYTNSMGILELRTAITESINRDLGFKPNIDQVLVVPANAVIDFTIRCVANPGDEIIMPDPGFPTYLAAATYAGMKPVGVPLREERSFCIDSKEIEKSITDKTRLIIINSPSNPTGSVIDEKDVLEIARIAERRGVFLLSDEVYSKILYSGEHSSPSVLDKCKERTIILGSMSKAYAMSGWRIGYAVGPKELIKKMGLLSQTIISCLPAFTQLGAVAALEKSEEIVRERVGQLRQRRDVLFEGLRGLKSVSIIKPEGAYYLFLNVKNTNMGSQEFSDKMLEAGVCVLAGDCFGKHGEGYVRLSYGSVTIEQINEAVKRIKALLLTFEKVKERACISR